LNVILWENQKVSEHRKAAAFNTEGAVNVKCPYCGKENTIPESETQAIFPCEFCGETIEIEEAGQ
jgi:ribosomal protein S27E